MFYPVSDQVLPGIEECAALAAEHVLVATDPAGLGSLMRRVDESLNQDPEVRLWELRVDVDGVVLPVTDPDRDAGPTAARIGELVRTEQWKGGTRHVETEDPDRR